MLRLEYIVLILVRPEDIRIYQLSRYIDYFAKYRIILVSRETDNRTRDRIEPPTGCFLYLLGTAYD